MDSLTHIAIGACVGEAFFERGFGKKAMLWGALAQSIPDIDFISVLWLNTPEALLAHRGFTHSILFAVLMIPIFALAADKIHQPHDISFSRWIYFFAADITLHIFIDGFNNYGVGWFEPFNHARFSFNTVYVADPFFSLMPFLAFIFLVFLHKTNPARKYWWKAGLIIPFFYLCYCTVNKISISNDVEKKMKRSNIHFKSYFTTPAPFQNWLWYVVAEVDKGYHIGFVSVFDKGNQINLRYFPQNDSLLSNISNHEDLQKLIRFSKNYYTIERRNDTLVFNDLRFGQVHGWDSSGNEFVFHYFLEHPQDNKLVVQRGRFVGWNWLMIRSYLKRIGGT